MFVIPNQSSVPMAYKQFTDADACDPVEGSSRMIPSGNRERIVDCMEEFVKYTIVMRPHFALFGDRYSERQERAAKELALRQKQDAEVANGVDVGKV
jgi:arsenic resistance protein ArsH